MMSYAPLSQVAYFEINIYPLLTFYRIQHFIHAKMYPPYKKHGLPTLHQHGQRSFECQ